MERIEYKRVWVYVTSRFITKCPYRKGLLVGSHSCFFCKHCKGRTEDSVNCSFKDFYTPKKPDVRSVVSMDVMVNGDFRRTINVKPTGLKIIGDNMCKVLTEDDIRNAVAKYCPLVFKYEKWNVEYNYR